MYTYLPADAEDYSSQQLLMESQEVQHALAGHALPLLSLHDLASLTCTCAALRDLVYQQSHLWGPAAVAILPPQLAHLPDMDRAAVQTLMQRRADAKHNLMSGKLHSMKLLTDSEDMMQVLQFSPS